MAKKRKSRKTIRSYTVFIRKCRSGGSMAVAKRGKQTLCKTSCQRSEDAALEAAIRCVRRKRGKR